jgi:hypothetical protein
LVKAGDVFLIDVRPEKSHGMPVITSSSPSIGRGEAEYIAFAQSWAFVRVVGDWDAKRPSRKEKGLSLP